MEKEIIKAGKLYLGKIDYAGRGKKGDACFITWELRQEENGPEFSAQAEVWNHKKTDIYMGGQCVDEVAGFFKHNKKAQRIKEVWEKYHLNSMKAGTPEQETALEEWKKAGHKYDYEVACEYLKSLGLYEITLKADTKATGGTLSKGSTYKYGHKWIYSEIPPEIIEEIKGW